MDCGTVDVFFDSPRGKVSSSFGESVPLNLPEFAECGKPHIRLKRSANMSSQSDDLAVQEIHSSDIYIFPLLLGWIAQRNSHLKLCV